MKRIVVAITGATGVVYGIRLLQVLKDKDVESHLIISGQAAAIIPMETKYTADEVRALAHSVHAPTDLASPLSSGSFHTDGMVVLPCSIKTLSAIANSFSDNLIVRAADVTLKERRRLILCVRETPFHLGHLRLMTATTEMGAIIAPPIPAFYHAPENISDLVDQSVGKVLDLLGIENDIYKRWKQDE
jgi:flavin prenyltransferase